MVQKTEFLWQSLATSVTLSLGIFYSPTPTTTVTVTEHSFLMKGLCYKYMSYLSARSLTLSSFSSIFNLLTLPVTFPEIDVVWELRICVHLQYIKVMRCTTHDVYCVGDLLHPFQRLGYIWFYYLCFGSLFHWTMNGILTFFSAAAVIILYIKG